MITTSDTCLLSEKIALIKPRNDHFSSLHKYLEVLKLSFLSFFITIIVRYLFRNIYVKGHEEMPVGHCTMSPGCGWFTQGCHYPVSIKNQLLSSMSGLYKQRNLRDKQTDHILTQITAILPLSHFSCTSIIFSSRSFTF